MISNSDEKYDYIIDVVKRINGNPPASTDELTIATRYLYELTTTNTYPGSQAEAMQIGGLLSDAL